MATHVAARFAADRRVIGLEIYNEPIQAAVIGELVAWLQGRAR